jgi:hypothetical protein
MLELDKETVTLTESLRRDPYAYLLSGVANNGHENLVSRTWIPHDSRQSQSTSIESVTAWRWEPEGSARFEFAGNTASSKLLSLG